jgi:hypothetical protein
MANKTSGKSAAAVITPAGIASYAFVWKPQPSMTPGQDPKYAITLIVPKKADLSALKAAVKVAAQKKFGDAWEKMARANKLHLPFRDGDEEREDDPLYKGKIFFSAKSKDAPQIVDADLNRITDEFEFYSGCKARISVFAFGYDTNGNKGVAFGLNNVQKLGDGERLSGRRAAEDEFGAVEADGKSEGDDTEDDIL